ncbi:MAG: acetyl-CoA acetyltransferase [Lysobacteraceae bacterium]|nr:MAG: acetyl-CoA acetyltransferase [Xanthomonadaceae bacterium]
MESNYRPVVLVDGRRTPFLRASTDYHDLGNYDLARLALLGLRQTLNLNLTDIDYVIMGNVISNGINPNVARDGMLGAGYLPATPAFTVSQACISANRAFTSGADLIRTGQADMVVAGGVDSMSDVPIMFKKPMRKRLMAAQRAKGPGDYLKLLKGMSLSDLGPQVPAIAEFSTGLSMGQDTDRLVARFGVGRVDQDEFALRSHQLAGKAWEDGLFDDEVLTVQIPPKFAPISQDNGIRPDSTMEQLAKLKPAFVRPHGTITAANASYLTDGAAAVVAMSEEKAKALGMSTEVRLLEYTYSGTNPDGDLLMGPAHASAKLLQRTGLTLSDIDVFEFHEAFAGQVLANLNALDTAAFCKADLGLSKKIGRVPVGKLNIHGGSVSIGHPFGATGARLLTTARNRLIREDGRYALIAACAAGGLGSAIILERSK